MKEFIASYGILCTSIFTIIVAIGIPCYLATKQNKIALFEKRYEVYKSFIDLESYCLPMEKRERTSETLWWTGDIMQFLNVKQIKHDVEDQEACSETFRSLSIQLMKKIETTDLLFLLSNQDINIINSILQQFNKFCITIHFLDSLHTSDINKVGERVAYEILRTPNNESFEIQIPKISRKELAESYTNHRNALVDLFEIYQKANISQKLRDQMRLTKPPFKCFTCIKSIFCKKD